VGSTDTSDPGVWVEVLAQGERAVRFTVSAPDAGLVEIAGDFTDWQPVALARGSPGMWEGVLHISRGIHRIAVRVDGGPWTAPAGTRRVVDDYDGEVGILVVP
jgi:1,4-alpha-glucan branching enzyme